MKITKKGKVRLDRDDVRVGNFVLHTERDHYKIEDISRVFSVRACSTTTIGMLFRAVVENIKAGDEGSRAFLHDYCAVMFNILSVAPDHDFLAELQKSAVACLERHKDMYGIRDDLGKEEDERILKEEVELAEAEREARLETLGHE